MHIKKGDLVMVNSGESRGKTGRILKIVADKDRAIVEGLNIRKKHAKPSAQHPQGGIIEEEAGIHISNLNVVDPKTGKGVRIGRKKDSNNKSTRYSKKSGEEIK